MKPGYKQTEVGVIPEEWEVVALGSLTTTVASGKSRSGEGQGTYPVHGSTGIIGYTERPEYEGDSILAARVGANAGKLNLVSGKYGVTDNTIMLRLRGGYSLPFFWRQLETKRLNSLVFGSGQPLITGSQLKALSLTLPPLPEQRAIATALSDVDGLLGGLDRLIAKKRDLKQAAMQQLLTGQTRLPGFHAEWEVKRLGEITDSLDNLRVPMNEAQRSTMKGDYPYCGANGVLGFVDNYVVDDDIILMAEDGGYFDEYETRPIAYRMTGKCWVNNHAHILKAKPGSDQGFLFYSLVHKNILPFLASGTRAKLNKSEMNKIEVRRPKDLPEQTAIASVLTEMDAELAVLTQRREKTRALKQAMMQELLTGRTRLI